MNSYDTICHEHLEYYSLTLVQTILDRAGLKAVDVVMNAVNGGSFVVTAVKAGNHGVHQYLPVIDWLLEQEDRMGLTTPRPYREFEERVFRHRDDLRRLIRTLNADGKKVLGYGASTKGSVVLQFCGLTDKDIPAIADVNPDKVGCYTLSLQKAKEKPCLFGEQAQIAGPQPVDDVGRSQVITPVCRAREVPEVG